MTVRYSLRKMVKLFANSEDPDQMLHSKAPDLGLHYLLITLLGVSRLQWVKITDKLAAFSLFILNNIFWS